MKNEELCALASTAETKLWQIAVWFGINDGNIFCRLRRELNSSERERILKIIKELSAER